MQCYEKCILVVETFKQKDKVSPKVSKQNYDNQQHNNNNGNNYNHGNNSYNDKEKCFNMCNTK